MTTPRVTVPVEDLAGKLKAIRDKFLMPTPDKDFTDYAIMTRCVEALSAAPAPEGEGAEALREALIRADLKIRSLPGTDQSDVEFIREALATPAEAGEAMDAGFEAWLNERNLLPHGAWDWPSIVAMLNHHEDALRARSSAPEAREDAQPVGWLRAVDEEMVCAHLGVADAEDSFETAKKKLASLIQWNIAVATDPSVGGHPAPDALRVAVEALEPFSAEADNWAESVPDTHRSLCTEPGSTTALPGSETAFTVGDLRRAASALAALQAEQGAK